MKKNLFYAAFAIAMMASCTNEDNLAVDPADPTPDAEDKVALTLGIDAPSVNATVGARGTGSVGDVAGENNVWNSQQLFITMIDRSTGLVAVDGNGDAIMDYDSYTYVAPRKSEQTTEATYGKGKIRVYETYEPATPTVNGQPTEDKGILQYLYYPVQGTFDFYGWHLDDAAESNPSVNVTANNITISGITIDGTQDIMGAKTKPFTSTTNYAGYTDDLVPWAFSAKTARNEIDPILTFEHKLARVKFFVKAGSWSAALHNEDGSPKQAKTADATSTGAMYITAIKAQDMHSEFTMTLNENGITTSDATNPIEFELGDIDATTGLIDDLVPKAPNYRKDYTSVPTGETDYTQVGEAIMFLPVADLTADSLTFHLDMKQFVQLKEDETDGTQETGSGDVWDFETREDVPVKVAAVNVKKADGSYATEFKAGESYNVYITIYGFEKIEVSAELTPWVLGGDVDVDIEEGVSQNGTQTPVTPAPTAVDVTFNVTDGTQAIASPEILVWEGEAAYAEGVSVKVEPNNEGEYNLTIGTTYSYSVQASLYKTETGTITPEATTSSIPVQMTRLE